jgi:cell division transport system permease protein
VLIPVLKASEDKTSDVREQIGLNVYLHDDATKAEIDALERKLLAIEHVDGVEFISKNEAAKILAGRLEGDLRNSLKELKSNPLPASFAIDIDDPDNLRAVSNAIAPVGADGEPEPISPAIEEVRDARQDASKITRVTGAVTVVLGILAVLLLVASLLLVGNTIRLSIYARRREVEVMRLVGATNWFIRWPFIIEGVIVGLTGAAIAVAILWLGKVTVVDPLSENFELVDSFSTMGFAPLVIMLIASATIVSALGSGITLRRFLRV